MPDYRLLCFIIVSNDDRQHFCLHARVTLTVKEACQTKFSVQQIR